MLLVRQLRPLKMIRLLAHHSIAREIIRTILIALRIMEGVFMVDEIRNPLFFLKTIVIVRDRLKE